MKKINIMHITYDMRIGGTEMVIKNIIEASDKERFAMSIFCIEEPLGPWGEELQDSNINIYCYARKDGFDIGLIKAIRAQIKQNGINVLHCHQYTPWVYGALAAIGTNIKVIFTEHGRFYPDTSSWKRKAINPLLLKLTHTVTAISKATKQALVDYEFIPEQCIQVIYNGIKPLEYDQAASASLKEKLGVNASDMVFGTIARLDPIKNQKMMINAFAKLLEHYPSAKLIIVGDGELKAALESQVVSIKLTKNVIFTGYIPHPKDYLALFDIFLLSSLSEGTSMTLLEAMSLAKPCVVTDAGGNPEIVIDGETGCVVANDNTQEFYQAMQMLIENKEYINEYAKNAKLRFDHYFTEAHMSANYQHCYGA